jgi:arylsulfatase A-like enzyme
MSDQHNAGSLGCAGHRVVRTPHLDRLAGEGVRFTRAYCNNPICAPSRICFVTGQYCHTHRILGNDDFELGDANPNTLGAVLRRHGYQTAQIGKAHMVGAWDRDAYEHIRYCDLCDADRRDPRKHHYFRYLIDHGLADLYEDGALPRDHEAHHSRQGCGIAALPYEHTIEHWTGEETLAFLRQRDRRRPFFVHMSFERPHPNWTPAREYANLYAPADIALGPDAVDWWDRRWAGRPDFIQRLVAGRMANRSLSDLQRMLACHLALVTVIDMEIGRVLDELRATGDLDNTIVVYTADHGDFAGDHGICDKNLGIYESIHRIPFIVRYPGGPRGEVRDGIIESVDLLPTLCALADVPAPEGTDGRSIVPELGGRGQGKDQAICEWDFPSPQRRVNAIRTRRYRLVYYDHDKGGELYDHETDPYELTNRWSDPDCRDARLGLLERLFDQVKSYACKTDFDRDRITDANDSLTATRLIHKRTRRWSEFQRLL